MRKSTINLVGMLKEKTAAFPDIVNRLEKKDLHFMDKLLHWMKGVEDIFTTYSISQVSEIAGFRSKLLVPRYADNRNSIKKAELKIASELLYELQNTVLNVLKPFEIKIEESRELIRQLLLIVSQAKVIQYNSYAPFDTFVQEIWQFVLANDQLRPGAIKLKTTLIEGDIKLLIAEEINLEEFYLD